MAAVIAPRTVSVVPASTTASSHTEMKQHFSSPSPWCFVACTAPTARDCPFSLFLFLIQEGGKPPSATLSLGNCCLGRALFEKRLSCLLCWALQCITESALQSPTAIQHHLSLPLAALHHSRESAFQEGSRACPAMLSPGAQHSQQKGRMPLPDLQYETGTTTGCSVKPWEKQDRERVLNCFLFTMFLKENQCT